MARVYHVLKLGSVTALGGELVGNGLIIGPPLGTLDVLLRRAHFAGMGINLVLDAGIGVCRAYLERTRSQLAPKN